MRRKFVLLGLLGALSCTGGCVVAMGNKGTLRPCDRQAVVVNDQVYIVDVRRGCVRKLDPSLVQEAAVVTQSELNEDNGSAEP